MHNSKKVFVFFSILITSALAAGPVGQYLGFRVGKNARCTITEYDSVHCYWPTEYDTTWTNSGLDTTTILLEFNLGGNPAYLGFYRYHGTDTNYVDADTSWEETGIYMKMKDEFFDTFQIFTPYKIPFSIGSSWFLGMAGTYYVDIDGDGYRDTFKIWRDSVRIIAQEDVTVPYGTIRNAYKLLSHFMGYVGMTTQGIPIRDTLNINMFEWYKDSLWAAKDSVYQTEKIYVYFGGMWMYYANANRFRVSQLTNLWVGINEERMQALTEGFKVGPNPFRSHLVISAPETDAKSELYVYDASGCHVEQRKLSKNFVWRPNNLPAGVYYLMVKNKESKTINLGSVIYLK